MRSQHLVHRAEAFAPKLARHRISAARVRIDHSQQPHRLPLLLQFLVDSGMIASENAHAHDGDGDRTLRWQEKFSMAGCRKQIVNGIPGKSIWINVFVATRPCSGINFAASSSRSSCLQARLSTLRKDHKSVHDRGRAALRGPRDAPRVSKGFSPEARCPR